MTNLTVPVGAEDGLAPITVPDEGEEVCASTTGPGKGPVRPGYHGLLKRWYALIRGKISLKSLTVDTLGEQVVGAPSPGMIRCANLTATGAVNGNVGAFTAEVEAAEFDAIGGAGRVDYEQARLQFRNTTTGAGGANPPFATAISNELRALNLPKAWGHGVTRGGGMTGWAEFDGPGTILTDVGQSFNIKDSTFAADYVEFELAAPMANKAYCITCVVSKQTLPISSVYPMAQSASKFRIYTPSNNPINEVLHYHFVVFGKQDT